MSKKVKYGILGGVLVAIIAIGSLTAIGQAISYLSFMEHYDHLVRGLVDTKDLVYFCSGLALMLFLSHRVVDSSRLK